MVVTLGFTAWLTFSQEVIYKSTAIYIARPTLTAEDAKAVEVAASDAEEMGEAVESLVEVPVEIPISIPVERRMVAWIAAAVLVVVLVLAASAIWLSRQGPPAASLPAETSMVPGIWALRMAASGSR